MKTMKKIGGILLAIMMIAMVGTVFATNADMGGENGRIGEFSAPDTPTTQTDTVIIKKEITAYNPESVTVNAPTITYQYTIGAATVASGTTVKDNASMHNQINGANVNVTVAVKAGVGNPTITGTSAGDLAITPANQLTASQYGTANRFDLTVDFSSINWDTVGSGAGVYRYVITETTTTATKNAAGIAEGTTPKTLYLDVYVNGSGDIYGYVLFTNNVSIDGSTSEETAASTAGKVEGFVDDPANTIYGPSNSSNADKYYTFNLTLTKDVVNDAYAESTHHKFPFHVSLDNPTVIAAVLPIMTVDTNATQSNLSAGVIGTGTNKTVWEPKIADGATIKYVGIPCGTTITIYETNDVTGVSYTSESTNADTNANSKAINNNENSNTATISCNADALTAASGNHTAEFNKVVTFTNTLLQISPTGYVSRFAPYALILVGGIALLVIAMKKRKHTEED